MPKSYTPDSTTTSRRSLFAAAAPAVLLLAGAVQAAEQNPDAAIQALGERIKANRDEYDARTLPYMDGAPEPPENEARVAVLVAQGHRMAEELAELQAVTLAGLRVKATVMLDYMPFWADGRPSWDNHDDLMGWSLARDLLAVAGPSHHAAIRVA